MQGHELNDMAADKVSEMISICDPGAMMTRFIVLAEGIDNEGRRAFYSFFPNGSRDWEMMGLVGYMDARIRASVASERDDD